jgi:hypothetical protein
MPDDGIVLEDQYYTAECSLSYNGNIKPIQTWSGPKPFNNGSSEVPNSMWSGVSWMVNRTMDTGVFECLNNFTNNFVPPEAWGSDHVPDWSYKFQTSQMFVYCEYHRRVISLNWSNVTHTLMRFLSITAKEIHLLLVSLIIETCIDMCLFRPKNPLTQY